MNDPAEDEYGRIRHGRRHSGRHDEADEIMHELRERGVPGGVPSRDAVRATPISLSSQSVPKQRQLDRSEQEIVELDGRQRFFSLRDTWSRWIIIWISTSILTNVILTFLVGLGILDFQKYGWFINAVTVESFIQVLGLGYVAVRFLFSRG